MSSGSSKKSAVIMVLLFLCVAGVIGVLVFVIMNPPQSEDTAKQANVLRKKIDTSQALTSTVTSDQVKALDKRLGQVEEKISELGKIGDKITQFEEQAKNIELLMGKIDRLEAAIISTIEKKTEASADAGKKEDKPESEKVVPVKASVKEIPDKPAKKKVFKRKPAKKRTVTRRRQLAKEASEQLIYGSLRYFPDVGSGEETPEERSYDAGNYLDRTGEVSPGQRSYYTGQRPDRARYHLVRPGETIAKISRSYGMRVNELLRLNNIKPGTFVYPGEMVLVKPGSGRSREVPAGSGSASLRFGGTLNQISRRYAPTYGMSDEELRRYDKLAPGLAVYSD